ncbi:hypothetical protein Pmar_PMAR019173 [Perkinsus marinus ATCC 50983]|uniref:Uncharacterized protein n=1 Tax=Perkinsus marinus (strain ATCC 50983 / TXsc) TaxID=423536 RepID=C5KU26_PERM5|nr:hypothetical protein Pmar_PMAR019173 [Perkinsus marinus ATCC 50983]EER12068.1 hypothetical protein Pmar_PMAR019173 [Perkinsus marinus ATCC 50983]|eukprot:XP_002780273.1 hypothetical protein Pmar_PMAR019173 [Perkinsus marinus ATCC 50983]
MNSFNENVPTGGVDEQAQKNDDDITAENIAENCAKALASLKGRREVERLEREAWDTLKRRGTKLQEEGNEVATLMETVDEPLGRANSSTLGSAQDQSTEEVEEMKKMLKRQWHLLLTVDAMNQHRRAQGSSIDPHRLGEAVVGEVTSEVKEEEADTMQYALALATAAPEYAAAVANWAMMSSLGVNPYLPVRSFIVSTAVGLERALLRELEVEEELVNKREFITASRNSRKLDEDLDKDNANSTVYAPKILINIVDNSFEVKTFTQNAIADHCSNAWTELCVIEISKNEKFQLSCDKVRALELN